MTIRENALAVLRYQPWEEMPLVSFGYWPETLDKWAAEGHITPAEAAGYHGGLGAEDEQSYNDNGEGDRAIMAKLGFDMNWQPAFTMAVDLFPPFAEEILEEHPDGSRTIRDAAGLIVLVKPGIVSIPAEIGTSLTDREAWESLYLPRLQWDDARVDTKRLAALPPPEARQTPLGLHCGSLLGTIRNLLGVEAMSYLLADDEDLFAEMVEVFGNLSYRCTQKALESGVTFDYAHFWEDICFKNGPLINPALFRQYIGPQYRRLTDLLTAHGVDIVSVDCDGKIDLLLPIWLENGVNTMFPIEVGTWDASIAPWRAQYGQQLRGVGGMRKGVFAEDYQAVDREVQRLAELTRLGGYLPCPDHRIPPDAKFENVQYYCRQMRSALARVRREVGP